MADFKLSRIRFNWKGAWSGGADYIVDDMIEYNGYTYVALRTHTSADFYNDLAGTDKTPAQPKWKKQSEGVSWKGDWSTSTNYSVGNIVKYGASVYECTEAHTSSATLGSGTDGLVADITKWTLVAVSSADWKYNWTISTLYRINDLVRYNGKVYKCTAQHVSAATALLGLEADQSKWTILSDSDTWKGTWTIGTRYKANDIVRYGGIVYKCITGHTSADNSTLGLEEDQSKWEIQIEGIEYVTTTNVQTGEISGNWVAEYRYKKNDVVKRGGNLMKCLIGHTSTTGDGGFQADYALSRWTTYLPGSEFENLWQESAVYQPGDVVLYGGYVYKAVTFNTNKSPANYTSDWNVTFEGYNFRGDWNNAGSVDSSDVPYKTGDFVRLTGSLYIAIQDSTNLQPDQWPTYWEKVIDGRQFRNFWEDDTEYFQGDIVTWAGTAYVALKYHRSTESASRPDIDVEIPDNDYWKVMILGNRTNKLARRGDLKTFEDQDSTAIDTQRLAIGKEGAALVSTGLMPAWDTIDLINNVYYVSLDGIDDPDRGGTLNAPFRTVRYAAQYLLEDEINRVREGATIFVMAGDYKEILPISLPAKTALVGAELRSTSISPAINDVDVVLGPRNAKGEQVPLSVPTLNERNNMFYVRNGCGIRRLTLRGLTGTLSNANTYGTKRPSGGAFVSLDPGTGNDDTSVWIASKAKAYYTPTTATYQPTTGVLVMTIPQQQFTVSDATYDPKTGDMTITIGAHTLDVGETVKLANNSITFSCSKDNYSTLHPYPRVSDPASGAHLKIFAKTGTTISINVGKSNDNDQYAHKFESATTNGVTWNHNLQIGNSILIAPGALTFTCASDGNTVPYAYPRTTDPAYNAKLAVLQRTDTTITVNVGISSETSAHTFVSALAESVSFERISAGRSPYIQGVTTIGDNCIGMKIDGSLHNGGNRSIVANDFTQVLSDGIGYWATNLGRSELVSVFTYYAHIGYLAENGGILRATNGNNSYGDFGTVAEGFDANEVPQVATVNNRSKEAQVDNIFTDGSTVLAMEYKNAGETYTSATASFTQVAGTGLDARYEEYRQGAVNKIRLVLPQDSTNVGGRGFQFATNSAQAGDLTSITLAASESRTAAQINGSRIVITEGPGAGQYGYIVNYNASTKVAQVYKDSTGTPGFDNMLPGKVNATALGPTTVYATEPRVTVAKPTFNVTNNSIQAGAPDIGYSDGLGLWYYGVTGTDDFYTSADGSVWTNRPTSGQNIASQNYTAFSKSGPIMVAVSDSSNTLVYSNDGSIFDTQILPASASYSRVQIGGASDNVVMATATGASDIYVGSLTTDGTSTIVTTNWTTTALGTGNKDWIGLAYGAGKWIAIAKDGTTVTSTDNGITWSAGAAVTPGGAEEYSDLVFGNNCWVASMDNSDRVIYSTNGTDWYDSALLGDSTTNDWKVGYTQGAFVCVNENGNALESKDAHNWTTIATVNNPTAIVGGVTSNTPTWVAVRQSTGTGNIITGGAQAFVRVKIATGSITDFIIYDTGSGYSTAPTLTVFDPEEEGEPYYAVHTANGVLGQPTFYNRGTGYATAVVAITGDGYAEDPQVGNSMVIDGIDVVPGPGANVVFAGDSTVYRLVKVTKTEGSAPNRTITFQISPVLTRGTAPDHGVSATIRERYSQARLTGHDFLDIGTGNFANTNYPALYIAGQDLANETEQANEVREANGGRVFYTSTDQDGNYRVGELFKVSQAQGGVTLSADFFDLDGLSEIRLGGISVGGTQAVIREFSTETTFVANSNNIVPTQKALKAYIESRFTGGGSNLFTNDLTAGQVKFAGRTISNTAGSNNVNAMTAISPNFEIRGSLGGGLAALNMFFSARTERDDFNG